MIYLIIESNANNVQTENTKQNTRIDGDSSQGEEEEEFVSFEENPVCVWFYVHYLSSFFLHFICTLSKIKIRLHFVERTRENKTITTEKENRMKYMWIGVLFFFVLLLDNKNRRRHLHVRTE